MVDFITEDPFSKRLRENQDRKQATTLRNIRIEGAQSELDEKSRLRQQREGIDRALRDAVGTRPAQQPTAPTQPERQPLPDQRGEGAQLPPQPAQRGAQPQTVPLRSQGQPEGFRSRLAHRLASVPGGGALAVEAATADLDRQQKIMERTFELAATDPDTALAWAEQNGMPVPAQMQNLLRNKQVAAAISNGMKNINAIYGTGAGQAQKRFQAFQQMLKGIDAAAQQQGGVPSTVQQGVITDLPQPATAAADAPATKEVFDPTTGRKVVMQWDGQKWVQLGGVQSEEAAQGGRGRSPAAVQTAEWLAGVTARAAGRNEVTDQDKQAAFAEIQQAKSNPVARANLVVRVFDAMANDFNDGRTPQEKQQAAQDFVNQLLADPPRDMLSEAGLQPGTDGRVRVSEPAQQPASAPAPAAQPPASLGAAPPAEQSPFPQHPDAKRAVDGNWYVQRDGQFFRVDP